MGHIARMIYVLQASIGGPIKIGYTANDDVTERLRDHQTSCPWPLILLHQIPGSRAREAALHRKFADERVVSEWFEGNRVRAWLEAERAKLAYGPPPPPVAGPIPLLPPDQIEPLASVFVVEEDVDQRILDVLRSPRAWCSRDEVRERLGYTVGCRLAQKRLRSLARRGFLEERALGRGMLEWRTAPRHNLVAN